MESEAPRGLSALLPTLPRLVQLQTCPVGTWGPVDLLGPPLASHLHPPPRHLRARDIWVPCPGPGQRSQQD